MKNLKGQINVDRFDYAAIAIIIYLIMMALF